jgi:predicted acetyltransferase
LDKCITCKNDEAEIFVRVTVNQKRVNISLKRKIKIDSWDKLKSKAKANRQDARLLSLYLGQVKAKIFKTSQDLDNQGKLMTKVSWNK